MHSLTNCTTATTTTMAVAIRKGITQQQKDMYDVCGAWAVVQRICDAQANATAKYLFKKAHIKIATIESILPESQIPSGELDQWKVQPLWDGTLEQLNGPDAVVEHSIDIVLLKLGARYVCAGRTARRYKTIPGLAEIVWGLTVPTNINTGRSEVVTPRSNLLKLGHMSFFILTNWIFGGR